MGRILARPLRDARVLMLCPAALSTWLSGMAPFQAAPPRPHTVTYPAIPALTLEIDGTYRALPRLEFPIANLTRATRDVFVKTDSQGVATHAIIVQFESVNAGSDFRFQFPSDPPEKFGDQVYRFTSFVYDDARVAREQPDREAGRTRTLLRAHGVTAPTRWKAARLARVADPQGRSEVIAFYLENADDAPRVQLGEEGYATLPDEESARMLKQLRTVIRPVAG